MMNNNDLKKYIQKLIVTMVFISLFVLCIINFNNILYFVQSLINILKPFIYGGCIAYIIVPLCNKLFDIFNKSKKEKIRNKANILSITITEIVFISIIVIACVIILPQSIRSISDILKSMPKAILNAQELVNKHLLTNDFIKEIFGNELNNIEDTIMTFVKNNIIPNIESILTGILNSATSIGKAIINIIMAIFISIFSLTKRKDFANYMTKVIKALFGDKSSSLIIDEVKVANKMFSGFFFGKIVDSAIIGILTFIILIILNIPYALLVSVIVGITNIIPIAGPFIGAIPGIIIIFSESPIKSLYFLIIIIIIQQLDGNYIGPKCIGNATNLSTFWVLFAIIFFGGLWGIIGMVIGVPLLAVIFDIINKLLDKKLNNKNKDA